MSAAIDIKSSALLIVDLQNDFLHPDGAYGRAGQSSDAIGALPERVLSVASAMRARGGKVVSAQFTLVPDSNGPLISAHLRKLRPFLKAGDFSPGEWGHRLVDELQTPDFVIEKIAYSAFYMSRLEWLLRRVNIETLFVCGIVTNGGVASTVRDAHVRDFNVHLLEDGCAAFSTSVHETAISDLSSIVSVTNCQSAADLIHSL